MKPGKPGRRPPGVGSPQVPEGRRRPTPKQNPKLVDQTRKRLGKHYASKYQTMRRG
jgi:hypothetical protein